MPEPRMTRMKLHAEPVPGTPGRQGVALTNAGRIIAECSADEALALAAELCAAVREVTFAGRHEPGC